MPWRHKTLNRQARSCAAIFFAVLLLAATNTDAAWPMHVIDNSLRGADGVRLGDANKDGRPDIVTGWEEGGHTRVYFNPGCAEAKKPWPFVDVGETVSVEDAVFIDLDNDGWLDVVSSCEGRTRKMFVHWNPGVASVSQSAAWQQQSLTAAAGAMQWMFAAPIALSDTSRTFLVAGGKHKQAALGLFSKPKSGRDIEALLWQPLTPAGWIMSIRTVDMDDDGDADILYSDRRGEGRGVYWLENSDSRGKWLKHPIGDEDKEVMFLTRRDVHADGVYEVLAAIKPNLISIFKAQAKGALTWSRSTIPFPAHTGTAKAVELGDLNLNGEQEIIVTCEHAAPPLSGVFAMDQAGENVIDISGPVGIKFDRMELIDLDGDGDLDVLTCEERHNDRGLGVIWYENPTN